MLLLLLLLTFGADHAIRHHKDWLSSDQPMQCRTMVWLRFADTEPGQAMMGCQVGSTFTTYAARCAIVGSTTWHMFSCMEPLGFYMMTHM